MDITNECYISNQKNGENIAPVFSALPGFNQYLQMSTEKLWLEVQKEFPTGYRLSNVFSYLPANIVTRTGKLVAASIANKINPSHTGVCYASRKTLALDAEVSISTLDRFTGSSIGRAIFKSEIPHDKTGIETARRTLTRSAMLFCIAVARYKKTVSRLKQTVMAFALKAALALLSSPLRGRKKSLGNGAQIEPQKKILRSISEREKKTNTVPGSTSGHEEIKTAAQWDCVIQQNRITGKNLSNEREYEERQQARRKAQASAYMANSGAKKQPTTSYNSTRLKDANRTHDRVLADIAQKQAQGTIRKSLPAAVLKMFSRRGKC